MARPNFVSTRRSWMRTLLAIGASSVATMTRLRGQGIPSQASTLSKKFVVGFQGWFMCPDDGRPRGGWRHWFTANQADPDHVHFDLLPDTSELSPAELFPTGLHTKSGRTINLFSDQKPQTVLRQFQWMRDYGIDSVALQRFVVGIAPSSPPEQREAIDRVLSNVRLAAERTGRGFFIMYDIARADPENWARWLEADWQRLLDTGLTASPMYQRHKGRPVLALAGLGVTTRPGTAEQSLALLKRLRGKSNSTGGLTLLGTVPTGWRTLDHNSKRDPEWARVFRSFDIMSPWTVGRYSDETSFQRFMARWLVPDMTAAREAGIEYMPVVFPGFSWHNLYHSGRHEEKPINAIPRRCGRFLWMQASAFVRSGATMLYGAMFDEVDEGTALFKLVPSPTDLPNEPELLPLNEAGCNLSSDWYLRLSREISKLLKGEITPTDQMPLKLPDSAS